MAENQIEVEKDFVVTYNCHTDEYTIEDSAGDRKLVEGWQVYAHGYTSFVREITWEDQRTNEVKWGLRKSGDLREDSPQTIRWALKIPSGESSEVFVFVNSKSRKKHGKTGQVKWYVFMPKTKLRMQLTPCIINKIQLEQGHDDLSGMGILSPDFLKRVVVVKLLQAPLSTRWPP